jgi:hypothetical protein
MAFARHQVIVLADLDDSAAIHDDEPVGAPQGREPVGDGDGGAAADQVVERALDLELGLGIDGRGRLVQDENFRIDQQGAGDEMRWRSPPESDWPRSPTSES